MDPGQPEEPPPAAAAPAAEPEAGSDAEELLPPGWEAFTSRSTGQRYYIDTATGRSTYDRPAAAAAVE